MTTVVVREVVPTVQPAASRPRLLFAVVVLSTLAGGVHLAVADHHFEQGWLFGSFFVTVAAAQLNFAVLFLLPSTRPTFAVVGIVGNCAVLATYVMSRTSGVPVGWHAWTPEAVSPVDFVTAVAEVALIACLLRFVPSRLHPWAVNLVFGAALLAIGLRMAGMLT